MGRGGEKGIPSFSTDESISATTNLLSAQLIKYELQSDGSFLWAFTLANGESCLSTSLK